MNKEMPKGWREIVKEHEYTSEELTLDSFRKYFSDIIKSINREKDFTYLRYCPHEDTIVLFSTNPIKGCSKCIDELIKTI